MARTFRKSFSFTDGRTVEVRKDTIKATRNADIVIDGSFYKKLTDHFVKRDYVHLEKWTDEGKEKILKRVNPNKRKFFAKRALAKRFNRNFEKSLINAHKEVFQDA